MKNHRKLQQVKWIVSALGSLFFYFVFLANHLAQKTNQDTLVVQKAERADTLSDSLESFRFDTLTTDSSKQESYDSSEFRRINNKAFNVGEHLVFEIAYGFIKAGTATMSIPDTQWVHGRPCYHIVTTAESNKFFSIFFKVRDRVESWVDIEGIFPWKFEKHIREGKYRADKYVEYDQLNQQVIENKKDTLVVPMFVQGILSSFYYVRTVPLEMGKSFDIDNYGDGKLYPLKILVHKKERIKVPAGNFDCTVIEPILKSEGIFHQKGKLTIWLTDDEQKIPVLMKSKVLIGSIDARLKRIETKRR